jgi:cell division protein FtsL
VKISIHTIAQTTMIAIILAILVYVAVITTGSYTTQNILTSNKTSLADQEKTDSALRNQIASSLNYVHTADLNRESQVLL